MRGPATGLASEEPRGKRVRRAVVLPVRKPRRCQERLPDVFEEVRVACHLPACVRSAEASRVAEANSCPFVLQVTGSRLAPGGIALGA